MIAWAGGAVHLTKGVFLGTPKNTTAFGDVDATTLRLIRTEGALELYHGGLRAPRPRGQHDLRRRGLPSLRRLHPRADEALELHEVPLHRRPGEGQRMVPGRPGGRINNRDLIDTPLAEAARKEFDFADGGMVQVTLDLRTGRG